MRKIELLIIHSSLTNPNEDLDANDLDRQARREGYLQSPYHYVVKRDGEVQQGRAEDIQSPVSTEDPHSIVIVMIGGKKHPEAPSYTEKQRMGLLYLFESLFESYPSARIKASSHLGISLRDFLNEPTLEERYEEIN